MSEFEITTNAGPLAQALRNSPATIKKYLSPALTLSVLNIARQAKRNLRAHGSMAYSTLINSINSFTSLDGLEAEAFAGTTYARYVEEGTRGGGYPNQQTIIDWLRVKRISPRDPEMSDSELAYLIARKIALQGTPAAPFMEPAFQSEKEAAIKRVNTAVRRAIREIR
jgi:hypothetical protein